MENNENIISYVTSDTPQKVPNMSQRPMIAQMPILQNFQQNSNMQFPLLFFLFPRITILIMMMQGEGFGRRKGIQNITQIIRDTNGYIKEIVEFVI